MLFKVLVLAVYWNKELRLGERNHHFQLVLARMSGNMYLVHALVNDLRALLHQLVDHLGDKLFVAGNGRRGNYDEIHRGDSHLPVVAAGHSRKRRERLALRTCGADDQLLRGILVHVLDVDEHSLGYLDVIQLHCLGDDILHASAGNRDFSVVNGRLVDYLLNSVNITGECRDDYALSLSRIEQVLEAFANGTLRLCVARALGVRALGHKRQHSAVAEFAETRQVDYSALDGGIIYLEVAGVDYHASRRVDSKRAGVRNGMVNTDKLNGHAAHAYILTRLHYVQGSLRKQTVLLELSLYQTESKTGAVYRHVDLLEEVRQRADVILVAVGYNYSAETVAVLLKIREIRNNQVNAGHVVVRERKSAVNDEHIVAAFVNVKVLANLVKSAERGEPYRCIAYLAGLLLRGLALSSVSFSGLAARAFVRPCPVFILLHRGKSRAVLLVVLVAALGTGGLFGLLRLYALRFVLRGDVFCFCEELVVCQ